MTRSVLLLRAVNVSGRNRVPMARLRDVLADETDLTGVSTYIASGNIICDAPQDAAASCALVQKVIAAEFDVDTPVIARTHAELVASLDAQPFVDGIDKYVHAMFLAGAPATGAVEKLTERLIPGERLALIGHDLWIDYASGVQGTRLTKAVFDRALGVAGTARNLRTVRKLVELTR
ncbi:DUF1697 domain-containing protein [Microbacterium sp. NPDC056234]|uniref:DUF1697 domain-containing protein n=1 Tax=Microbacterium sp. NPDC056234 TaxID=3345757 RepID=UPI0035E00653